MARRFSSVTIWVAGREARDRARAASKQLEDRVPTNPIVAIVLAARVGAFGTDGLAAWSRAHTLPRYFRGYPLKKNRPVGRGEEHDVGRATVAGSAQLASTRG